MYETEVNHVTRAGRRFPRMLRIRLTLPGPAAVAHCVALGRALHGVRVADVLYHLRPLQSPAGWQMPQIRRRHGENRIPDRRNIPIC